MSENKYKPFDLEVALKQPERVICRNGQKPDEWQYLNYAKIIQTVYNGSKKSHFDDGKYFLGADHPLDLFLLPETKTVWVNIFRNCDNDEFCTGRCMAHDTEQEARGSYGAANDSRYIGSYPITIELP